MNYICPSSGKTHVHFTKFNVTYAQERFITGGLTQSTHENTAPPVTSNLPTNNFFLTFSLYSF